jgi:hypothetical protein
MVIGKGEWTAEGRRMQKQIPHTGLKCGRVPFLRQGRRDDNLTARWTVRIGGIT